MSAADRLAEVAERVIVEHVPFAKVDDVFGICSCGWKGMGNDFPAHVAAMVAAAQVEELGLREERWGDGSPDAPWSDELRAHTRLVSDWTADATSKEQG